MKKYLTLIVLTSLLYSCTKEVPENKRFSRTSEEVAVSKVIDSFVSAYNSGNIGSAMKLFDSTFKGIIASSDEILDLDSLRVKLTAYRGRYQSGRINIGIDEIETAGDHAYLMCSGSFTNSDRSGTHAILFSERELLIIKKQKGDGWKILRSLSAPNAEHVK